MIDTVFIEYLLLINAKGV